MRASENRLAAVSLFVLCMIASGAAAAMEQNGSAAPSLPGPEPSFPAFLDADRLPALLEAWRARELGSQTVTLAPPGPEGDAMSAARAAIKRIGGAARQAPAVRQAAEELSRRFSAIGGPAGSEASSGVVVTTAVGDKPASEASRQDAEEAAAVAADGAAPLHAAAPVTSTSALPEAEMRPQSARLDPIAPLDMTPRTIAKIPPLPVRAPEATAPAKTKTAKAKAKAKATKSASSAAEQKPERRSASPLPVATRTVTAEPPPVEDAPVVAGRREVFPPYMRAFGWDDQP
jgi:hypothetical protein